ncbi:hypothetical protein E2C01_028335 [Portunus trituberculatus]|uniref:Uncharacterized protein n=1 Tax=Portunus trituberculatus TaxID=210409 RepID=A0A5B7EKD5_PORTR|nr:hypothetical protein [Portunus trituberculatus]
MPTETTLSWQEVPRCPVAAQVTSRDGHVKGRVTLRVGESPLPGPRTPAPGVGRPGGRPGHPAGWLAPAYCRYAAAGGRLGLLSAPGPAQPIPSVISWSGRARVSSSSLLTPPRFDTFHHPPATSWSSRYLIGSWHGDISRDVTLPDALLTSDHPSDAPHSTLSVWAS